jgi:hypothetical protein
MVAMQRQIDDMKRSHADELAAVRRQIPPAEPKPVSAAPAEPDWDNLIFSKPKEAMALIKKQAKEEAVQEVTARYNQDQGQQRFWNSFYDKYKEFDRRLDHDLIQLTLDSNLKDLANIPVDKALDQLAGLTRERILRYAGGKPRGGKKAVVEGAEAPSPRSAPREDAKRPVSIGDVITKRRQERRSRRSVAA